GWVMSLGAVLLIVLVLFFFAKHKLSHEDKDRCGMNSMKHGCGCPMMDMNMGMMNKHMMPPAPPSAPMPKKM
ncbi:MAG: hypothetical protein V1647_00040, partial [Pseudomonadota bacterium]